MDANGTQYHLLLGYADWASCTFDENTPLGASESPPDGPGFCAASGLGWDAGRHELTLRPQLYEFTAARSDHPPSIADRSGAGRDSFGAWYWIGPDQREILMRALDARQVTHYWSPGDGMRCAPATESGDFQPVDSPQLDTVGRLAGLAVTTEHYLVVGTLEPPGLLVFDLYAGGAPRQLLWPLDSSAMPSLSVGARAVPFAPFDMAPAPDGGVWILDRDNRRFWALDRRFNLLPPAELVELDPGHDDDFQPAGHDPQALPRRMAARIFPGGVRLDATAPAVGHPIAIEALSDGTVLILDHVEGTQTARIYRFGGGALIGALVEVAVAAYDFAFVPAASAGDDDRLYIAGAGGNQAYVFTASLDGVHLRLQPVQPVQYLPMRRFAGKGLVAADRQVYYDFADTWVPLVEQRRPRYAPQAALYTPGTDPQALSQAAGAGADLLRPAFDGREPGCVWHRLMIDACIPPASAVRVWSRAADDVEVLANQDWQAEPALYRRGDGSELPYTPKPAGENSGTWELLFQRARGQYLQLKIELSGNSRVSPRLRALRIYYPRFSYLRYLPSVYREDEQSGWFLDRFLANLEGVATAIEDKIAAVQVLFDAVSAPPETLDWLASWFGVALDPAWDDARRRLFIRHAMIFFQHRGTIPGLLMALRLALDTCPDERIFVESLAGEQRPHMIRIVERFRARPLPAVLVGDPTEAGVQHLDGSTARWTPKDGADALHRRYRDQIDGLPRPVGAEALSQGEWYSLFSTSPDVPKKLEDLVFPIVAPPAAAAWRQIAQLLLGFVPAAAAVDPLRWQTYVGDKQIPIPTYRPRAVDIANDWDSFVKTQMSRATRLDQQRWQSFLARRYHRISALADAYEMSATARPASFDDVLLPSALPSGAAALWDWYQFETRVLAIQRAAHRFVVLLPVPAAEAEDTTAYQRRLAQARRLVELEKPAHTTFDVRLYWAAFRVDEVRLGEDTLLGPSGRAVSLLGKLVLGQQHLASGYLAPGFPFDTEQRFMIGRERLDYTSGEGHD